MMLSARGLTTSLLGALLAPVLAGAGCQAPPPPPPPRPSPGPSSGYARIDAPTRLLPVGEMLTLKNSSGPCPGAQWTLAATPASALLRAGPRGDAAFTALAPGRYAVRLSCPDNEDRIELVAFQPSLTLRSAGLRELEGPCRAAAATSRGRLLCGQESVRLIDVATGRTLSEASGTSPEPEGVAGAGELAATAALGCPACRSCCKNFFTCPNLIFDCLDCCTPAKSFGAHLYRIDPRGTLQLLTPFTQKPASGVALDGGGLLVVASPSRLYTYDVSDPASVTPRGCSPAPASTGGTRPVTARFLGDRLFVWNGRSLDVHDPALLGEGCDGQAPSRSRLGSFGEGPVKDVARRGDRLYALDEGASVMIIALGDTGAMTRVGAVADLWGPVALAIREDLLYVAQADRVLAFDLGAPEAPRPAGSFPFGGTRLLAGPDSLWALSGARLQAIVARR